MTENLNSKGKYGALIQQARKPDNQIARKPNSQKASEPDSQKASESENQIASEPDTEAIKEKDVNLCVKVPESLRRHWAAESKRQGVTMTEVIIAALTSRFGQP